jgi:error-prone DNA polymerase
VIHLMADNLIDRSADLRLLSGEAMPKHKPVHSHVKGGHPRNVRVLPASRDFH